MTSKGNLFVNIFLPGFSECSSAQESRKFYFTTSTGIFTPVAVFSKSCNNSLSLNPGFEYRFSKHYCTQFVGYSNALKYNQQVNKIMQAHYIYYITLTAQFF